MSSPPLTSYHATVGVQLDPLHARQRPSPACTRGGVLVGPCVFKPVLGGLPRALLREYRGHRVLPVSLPNLHEWGEWGCGAMSEWVGGSVRMSAFVSVVTGLPHRLCCHLSFYENSSHLYLLIISYAVPNYLAIAISDIHAVFVLIFRFWILCSTLAPGPPTPSLSLFLVLSSKCFWAPASASYTSSPRRC